MTPRPRSIGGTDFGQGNIIAANHGSGIATSGRTRRAAGRRNAIGTDAAGVLKRGNLEGGVSLASSSNTIGGTASGASNVIEYNGSGRVGAGVQLVGKVDHNTILSNFIYGNAGLGINLGSGPTPNHAPGTPGPNDYQNYPVISLAENDGTGHDPPGNPVRESQHLLLPPVLLQPATRPVRLRPG